MIVAAHDEEAVIERRLENLLALDYPRRPARDRRRLRRLRRPHRRARRGGRRARAARPAAPLPARREGRGAGPRGARDRRARSSPSRDANATWAPDALRRLVRSLRRSGRRLRLRPARARPTPAGSNREGVYWRFETWLRAQESALGSVTGGNGSIYAVRRSDYVEVDPRFGHDLSLPYLMVQRGRRAVYEPEALAFEKPTPEIETEYRRKVRMFEHCWLIVAARARCSAGCRRVYLVEILSHRHLRYAQRPAAPRAARDERRARRAARGLASTTSRSALQVAFFALAARAASGLPRYYALVTWATVVALWNYLRRGVPATWDAAEGTR